VGAADVAYGPISCGLDRRERPMQPLRLRLRAPDARSEAKRRRVEDGAGGCAPRTVSQAGHNGAARRRLVAVLTCRGAGSQGEWFVQASERRPNSLPRRYLGRCGLGETTSRETT